MSMIFFANQAKWARLNLPKITRNIIKISILLLPSDDVENKVSMFFYFAITEYG